MILGVLLVFAALAVVSSLIGSGETETDDPVDEEGGLNVSGSGTDDLLHGRAGDDRFFGRGGDDLILGGDGDDQIDGGSGDDFMRGEAGKT